MPAIEVAGRVAEGVGVDGDLVVGGVVHEDEAVAVAVQELHLALVDDRLLDLLGAAEGAVDHGAGADVAQRGADEGAALAGLDVLELHHLEEALGEVEGHAVLQVVGGDGHGDLACGDVSGGWDGDERCGRRTGRASGDRHQLGRQRQGPATVGGDHHRVFDADAAVLGEVHTRLDGDDRAGGERSSTVAATRGSSWISRPTPWPVLCENASPQPASSMMSRQAWSTARHVDTRRPPPRRRPAGWRPPRRACGPAWPVGSPDHERAGHVGAVAVDDGRRSR